MAFVGFAVMTPVAAMSILDTIRWRPVVYADTPKTLNRYHRFIQRPIKDERKPVLFVFGASHLSKVAKDADLFSSVFLFDDVPNLMAIKANITDFNIVDIENDDSGASVPKHLTPGELAEVVNKAGGIPNQIPLITKLTNTLGKRKPSVLESSSRLPKGEKITVEAGVRKLLTDVKHAMDGEAVQYSTLVETYAKYIFRMLPRTVVTTMVTKKLPAAAKEPWATALAFADSAIGASMAKAFYRLCMSGEALTMHEATKEITAYSGDFLYLVAIHPPYKGCVFIPEEIATLKSLPDQPIKVAFTAPKAQNKKADKDKVRKKKKKKHKKKSA